MKVLTIPDLSPRTVAGDHSVYQLMDSVPFHTIDINSWPEYQTTCSARFSIAHTGENLYIKYYIEEETLQATQRELNGAVNKDSCVELFISFNGDKNYYNIEFNCLGIGKVAHGSSRTDRSFLPAEVISEIGTDFTLKKTGKKFFWDMLLSIPVSVFRFSDLASLKGISARANFYKCGDELPTPHFLSWNKINTATPDFHAPLFFGDVEFL